MLQDAFGKYIVYTATRFIEPAWKLLLQNKALLPILWELFPDHPNLLPVYFTQDKRLGDSWVKKPIFSREGCNISICHKGKITESTGLYGKEGYIYQQYFALPNFNGYYPTLGLWIIGDRGYFLNY